MTNAGGKWPTKVWVVDFEFVHPDGEQIAEVHTLVAQEVKSGRRIAVCGEALQRLDVAPYDCGPDALVVAYAAEAEMQCHIALGWPMPDNVLDLLYEYRWHMNGVSFGDKAGGESGSRYRLIDALFAFGLPAMAAEEKDEMRQLAMRGGRYTADEEKALVEYCAEDVEATARLLSRMESLIDLPRAILRGEFAKCGAHIQHRGIPMDVELIQRIDRHAVAIKAALIKQIDTFGFYEGESFREQRFLAYLQENDLRWPLHPSGKLKLDTQTWENECEVYTQLEPIRQLRKTLARLRLADLPIGRDGRSRYYLGAFNSKTGRHYPRARDCIFAGAKWTRHLIKPAPGTALVYVDWSSAEIGIAAALSKDEQLAEAYFSGDPYITFATQAGAAPAGATKRSHPAIRDKFKATMLAVNYGMGARSLARRLDGIEAGARQLLNLHQRTYQNFWAFSQRAQNAAFLHGEQRTLFGWKIRTSEQTSRQSAGNWPVQATGAEILRIACIEAHRSGLSICATVHDAILFETRQEGLQDAITQMEKVMAQASAAVLNGFELRADAKVVCAPDRYVDEDGQAMFDVVMDALHKAEAEG